MKSPEIGRSIQRNYALAQALGIEGTPAFVIGEEIVASSVDLHSLEKMIEKEKSKSD